MATEINKQVMQRFVTFINTASADLAVELISPNAMFYVPGRSEPMTGPGGYLEIIQMMRAGFSDIQWTLDDLVAEDDKIAARFTMTGTHNGPFLGVLPTGKHIKVQAFNFYRLLNGKIVEEHGHPDLMGIMQQIGAIPST